MKHKIEPYYEDKGTGLIRHVMVKCGETTGQVLVVIVTSQEMFPGRNNFVKDLRAAHPEISTIVQNVNKRKTSIILGDFERVIYGKGFIQDVILGKKFQISAKTFFQVNAKQMEILYRKAIEFAKPQPTDLVVDAYSGVGTIAIILADLVKQVLAVEISPAAVKNANQNAWLNNIRNIRFHQSDAVAFMKDLRDAGEKPDLVIVDPPRQGLDPEFVSALIDARPPKIIYISCDPLTMARDLQFFTSADYLLRRVQPVDMFCQTAHVETVSLLSLK